MNKTYSARPKDIERKWYVIDAAENNLGRISTEASRLLIGKDKPMFTSHIDCGDFVIIINAKDLKVSGNKLTDKKYYRHSGYPGGLYTRSLQEQLDKDPAFVINKAIKGMLPVNKLRDGRLLRLKIYTGSDHPHQAQKPITITTKKGDK